MISVNNVFKSFGSVCAVDNLSCDIREGEIVGLLGPNGAGKTTTMRMMTGFLSPDSGVIRVNNIDVSEDPISAQREIGYMPENNPLYKDMLVSEMLTFAANLRQLTRIQIQSGFDFAVEATNIADVFYRPIGELSKGYRQRVGIAVALLHRPTVLILDEPSEGLDPNQRSELRTLIKKLAKGHTVVVSTHVMQEVEAVCTRLLIINKGKLVANGTPETLLKKSDHVGGLVAVLEGDKIMSELKRLKGVASVDTLKTNGKKLEVRLFANKGVSLQPELTKLAGKNHWTIWNLMHEEHNLEELFRELTQ